jgi:hypothetical protein
MTHILADIDQIVTEYEMNPAQWPPSVWMAKIRHSVDGRDYDRTTRLDR